MRREVTRREKAYLSTTHRLGKKYKEKGEVKDKPWRGRRRKTTGLIGRKTCCVVLAKRPKDINKLDKQVPTAFVMQGEPLWLGRCSGSRS